MPINELGTEAMVLQALANPKEWMRAQVMAQLMRKGGKKDVLHQQTCPVCGRKLVNTYRRGNEWKCRVCWEEADNTAKATH